MDDYFTTLSNSELLNYYNSISDKNQEDFIFKLKEYNSKKKLSIEKIKKSIHLLKERIHCVNCILLRQMDK